MRREPPVALTIGEDLLSVALRATGLEIVDCLRHGRAAEVVYRGDLPTGEGAIPVYRVSPLARRSWAEVPPEVLDAAR